MNGERLKQIEEIFHSALEIPVDEREDFLREQCGGDIDLQRELMSLLCFHVDSDELLETPPESLAAEMFADKMGQNFIGKNIGHYKVQKLLGKGGMGIVYLAEDTKLDRKVALKILPPEFVEQDERMKRFVHEAKSASALNHPNIITIYEINESDGIHYIATEFIDGKTLKEYAKSNLLNIDSALKIAVQIAEALNEAHSIGLIHRDIKPDNLMIRPNGLVKILDFGIAKLSEHSAIKGNFKKADDETKLSVNTTDFDIETHHGTIVGTPNYMSPEQAAGKEIDTRTDIFNFGVVLYEILHGKTPFAGETPEQTISNILETEKSQSSVFAAHYPPELEYIFSKTLAKNPNDRFQTAGELLESLKKLKLNLRSAEIPAPQSLVENRSGITDRKNSIPTDKRVFFDTSSITAQRSLPETENSAGNRIWYKNSQAVTLLFIGAVFICFAALYYTDFFDRRFDSEPPLPASGPIKQNRLTTLGKVSEATISPDGKFLAYILRENPGKSLYVRRTADNKTVKILQSPELDCQALAFSPDAEYIYFLRSAGKTTSFNDLYRIETFGGEPQKMIADVDSSVSFSPDGKEFVFRRNSSVGKNSKLFIADSDGTNEREFADRSLTDAFINKPVWSPDGKTIATFAASDVNNKNVISVFKVAVADGKQEKVGQPLPFWAINLAWLPDGKSLLINGQMQRGGPHQIMRMVYPSGELSEITRDFINYTHISVTADGKSLVTIKNEKKINIFTAPFEDLKNLRQLTSFDGVEFRGIQWTPDGRILYSSNYGGKRNIWIMNSDGTEQKQLTDNGSQNYNPVMSPNGRYIVYVSTIGNEYHVWRMNSDGGNPVRLTDAEEDFDPAVTPDGEWVVYASIAPQGPFPMLWKVPIEGGVPIKLTDKTSRYPVVSPDGKSIAFKFWRGGDSLNGLSIMTSGGIPTELNLNPDFWSWTADSKSLIYADSSAGFSNLFQIDLPDKKPKQITDFKNEKIYGFDVSRDGKNLVFLKGEENSDIIMLNNF